MNTKVINLKSFQKLSKQEQASIGGGTRHPRVCADGTVVVCIPRIPGNTVECINGKCVEMF
ncbi:hypothetical protein [Aquimarina algicola]|uniref:Uncharacterized protein n=1 Tax=Aquimarina algicola TaxID=2589995 RepID=A0A504J2C8_9FLAO|nr:hypothetical protein [Aquimarina algicola]TPN81753.1 hypothetical protein FHK87_24460 [Aquimarina algicola]